MPSLMEFLRMQNIFGNPMNQPMGQPMGNDLPSQGGFGGNLHAPPMAPPQQESPFARLQFGPDNIGTTQVPSPDDYDVGSRMAQLYTPEHSASDKFNQMVSAYPQEHEPSTKLKVGGSIMGALTDLGTNFGHNRTGVSGHDVYDDVTGRRKFLEDVGNWKTQIGPVGQAAALERTQNANERLMAHQTVSDELRQKSDENKFQTQEAKNKISEDRAKVYRLKSLMPQHQFDFSGPTVKVGNKQTGEVIDTGLATGSLSDSDKLELQQSNAMTQIGARTQGALDVEDRRQGGREGLAESRGWKIGNIPDPNDSSKNISIQYNEITGEVKPITMGGNPTGPITKTGTGSGNSSSGKPELPSQTRVREFDAARKLYNTRPDLRTFIRLGSPSGSDFTVTPPSKGMFGGTSGPTAEQYQAIQDAIYGSGGPIAPVASHVSSGSSTNAANRSSATVAPTGRVVIYKDGKAVGTVPAEQAEDARKQGYSLK
jgi:hypothetical protein